ncbi:MAG TPA: hypothetical protein VNR70_10835 [Steroidobacteraceae bacterium]|nr:hypothetical protein [Steroidobacteraceae bacterium]
MTVRQAIFVFLISVTVLAVPLQIMIDPSPQNCASACIVMASCLSVLLYIFWSTALETHPLSTFTLLGFSFTSQLGALLFQTAAWTALSSSLYDPLYTFGTLAFYQGIALAVHSIYRFFSKQKPQGSVQKPGSVQPIRGLLTRVGLYRVPPVGTLWFMGFVGLCTFFFSHYDNVLGKVAGGFTFLAWAPFLIIFYLREVGESYCNAAFNRGLLVAYAGVAIVLGLAFNTRSVMLQGAATIGLLYLLAGMRSNAPLMGGAVLKFAALVVVLLAVSVPVSDLATSMVIARQWRGRVSAAEMIKTTLFIMGKPTLIASAHSHGESAWRYGPYDEHYITNPLLNRLVVTKYHDNSFHFAGALTSEEARARLRAVSIKFAWAGLPTPVLAKLGIAVSKKDLAYSMGDYLGYLSRGLPLGGHKIGSMFAQGIALFGPLFPFVYAAICLLLFWLIDLLTVRPVAGKATLSTLGMLQIWLLFLAGISYEGLHIVLYFVFRNFWQTVIIYVLVCALARTMMPGSRSRVAATTVPIWQRKLSQWN